MTFEQWIAQQGYRHEGNGLYSPLNAYSEYGQVPNLNEATLRDMYYQAIGQSNPNPSFGSAGQPDGTNVLVNIGGQLMHRVGESNIYGNPSIYDPTYGYVFPEEQYRALTANKIEESSKWGPLEYATLALFGGGLGALGAGAGAAAGTTAGAGFGGTAAEAAAAGALTPAEFAGASGYGAAAGGAGGTAAGYTATLPDGSIATIGNGPGIGGTFADVSTAGTGLGGESVYGAGEFALPGAPGGLPSTLSTTLPSFTQGAGALSAADVASLQAMGYSAADIAAAGGGTALASGGFAGGASGAGGAATGGLDFFNAAKSILGTPGVSQLIGGGLNALGGVLGSRAQASAAGDANNLLWRQYQQNREDLTPYRLAGYGALGGLIDMTTPGKQMDRLRLDPGYDFRQAEGQNALDMRQRANGTFYSGAGLKGASEYNQNFASGEFNNAYNRLAALAGTGQAAANTTAQMGQQTAQGVANNTVDIGNARASGYAAGLGGIANGLNQYQNALQTQQLFDLLAKNRTP